MLVVTGASTVLLLKSIARYVWTEGNILHAMVTKLKPISKQELTAVNWGPPTHLGVGKEEKKGEKWKDWERLKEKEIISMFFFLSWWWWLNTVKQKRNVAKKEEKKRQMMKHDGELAEKYITSTR